MTRVISIGTTHPWNIAGLGLDIAIGREFGVEVFTVVAGVSAQNDRGVTALYAIPAAIVRHQLDVTTCHPELVEGRDALGGAAIRVGALVSAENVRAVAEFVRAHPHVPAVVDPVFAASNGGRLADEDAIVAIRDELAIAPSVILTPNLDEAAMLLGSGPIERDESGAVARSCSRAVILSANRSMRWRPPTASNFSKASALPARCAEPVARWRWRWPANWRAADRSAKRSTRRACS